MNDDDKRRYVTTFQKYLLNPFVRMAPGFAGAALIETVGRKSGKPRRTPVGAHMRDGALWIVSEQGRKSDYVRNLEHNPRVRVRFEGRWIDGIARVVPDADPAQYTPGINGMMVRLVGTDLLVIRVDPN